MTKTNLSKRKPLKNSAVPSEVNLMKELADWLDSWAEQCPTTDKEKFKKHRAKLLKVTQEQDTILEWLSWHKPELKKTVEDKIGELYGWSLSDLPNENDLTYNTMRLTTGCARILAETLRHIAKMARGNAETRTKAGQGNKTWKPPKGYMGSKSIVQDYHIPRSTLQGWAERDKANVRKDPQTKENYYQRKWLDNRRKNYKSR